MDYTFSGRPEPVIGSTSISYTGGDVKNSGYLSRIFDVPRSGPNPKRKSGSGPATALQPTGLIASGEMDSPSSSSAAARDSTGKSVYGSAVTTLGYDDVRLGFSVSRKLMWVMAVMGLVVGAVLTVAVKHPVILAAAAVLVPVMVVIVCGIVLGRR